MFHVLIIDDEEQFRTMLEVTLQKVGYEVETAADGREGLYALKKKMVDLVVTDLVMPEMEGLELITELHREYPDLKIIAVSGGGRVGPETYLELAKRFGASHSFEKPLDMKAFLGAVRELLGADHGPDN